MNRKIKIPNINKGQPFEIPTRKTRHRMMMYEKMVELEKEKPEVIKNENYRQTMEAAYLALYIIQDQYKEATIDDILDLPDNLEDEDNLTKLSCIVHGTDYEKLKKQVLKGDKTDFQLPKREK